MKKTDLVIFVDYPDETPITLDELCEICHSTPDFIRDLVAYEIIIPLGNSPQYWQFTINHLNRAKVAARLQHDLEMNMQGIAIVLDLLERIDDLQTRMDIIERHLLK